jgi:AcrR family transcriptional regulator
MQRDRLTDALDGLDGAMAPSQDRSRRSTVRLLEAAADLIAERGYSRMTLADVGQRAGFSHALVNRRFGSKENLVVALFDRMVSRWRTNVLLPAMAVTPPVDSVLLYVEEIRKAIGRDPVAMRALFTLMVESLSIPALTQRISDLYDDQYRVVHEGLNAAVAAGAVPENTDSDLEARLIVNAMRGASLHWLLVPESDVDDELRAIARYVQQLSAGRDGAARSVPRRRAR